jgi:hypothetical protein
MFVLPVVSPFRLRVSQYLDRAAFPAPATSNAAYRFQPKPFRFRARAIWRLIFFSTQSLTKPKHSLKFPTAK